MHIPTLSHITLTSIHILLTTHLTHALTILTPTSGSTLDPTQPITLSWTSTPTDPSTISIILDNSASGGLVDNLVVASDVSTSSGSYTLPPGTAKTYGQGFVLKVEGNDGDVLATSGSFALAMGSGSASSTITSTGTSSSVDSGPFSFGSATSGSGSITTATSSMGGNSFTTSTISRNSSGGSGSASSTDTMSPSTSPTATTSQNAQPKLKAGGGQGSIVFTAAGIIAGLAALFA